MVFVELAFLDFGVKLVFTQNLENAADMGGVDVVLIRKNADVVEDADGRLIQVLA